jgi:hypothetical protein
MRDHSQYHENQLQKASFCVDVFIGISFHVETHCGDAMHC